MAVWRGRSVVVRRGEVWWTDLGTRPGSAPAHRRPVVVVQSDAFNRSAIGTVVVAAVTSSLSRGNDPGNVHLPRRAGGLPKESVVNVSQLATVDRTALVSRAGRLPDIHMKRVTDGLRLVLET